MPKYGRRSWPAASRVDDRLPANGSSTRSLPNRTQRKANSTGNGAGCGLLVSRLIFQSPPQWRASEAASAGTCHIGPANRKTRSVVSGRLVGYLPAWLLLLPLSHTISWRKRPAVGQRMLDDIGQPVEHAVLEARFVIVGDQPFGARDAAALSQDAPLPVAVLERRHGVVHVVGRGHHDGRTESVW